MSLVKGIVHREIVKIEKPGDRPEEERLVATRGFAKRFPDVEKRVEKILREDRYARKNYLWLCMVYWAKMNQIKIVVPMERFHTVNPPETICRASRRLFEKAIKGEKKLSYLMKDMDNIDQRKETELEVHEFFSSNKVEGRRVAR